MKRDGTRAETRFGLSAKRTSPLKSAGGLFSLLLAAEVCASAVVMLDTPCSEVESKTTGYPLHSPVSPSLPLPCFTVCHQVSIELYQTHTHRVKLRRKGVTWLKRWFNYEQCKCYVNEVPCAWFLGRMYAAVFDACDLIHEEIRTYSIERVASEFTVN